MKRRFNRQLLISSILAVGLSASVACCKSLADQRTTVPTADVSALQLKTSPESYRGKIVRIKGKLTGRLQPGSIKHQIALICPVEVANSIDPPSSSQRLVVKLEINRELKFIMSENEELKVEGLFEPLDCSSEFVGLITVTKLQVIDHSAISKRRDLRTHSGGYGAGPEHSNRLPAGDYLDQHGHPLRK